MSKQLPPAYDPSTAQTYGQQGYPPMTGYDQSQQYAAAGSVPMFVQLPPGQTVQSVQYVQPAGQYVCNRNRKGGIGRGLTQYTGEADQLLSRFGFTAQHDALPIMALDISGSMQGFFDNQEVGHVIKGFAALTHHFRDNGRFDLLLFGTGVTKPMEITVDHFSDETDMQVEKEILAYCGGLQNHTYYSYALDAIADLAERDAVNHEPIYAQFVTDGDCNDNDRADAKRAMLRLAKLNVFLKIVALNESGAGDFLFLDTLQQLNPGKVEIEEVRNPTDITFAHALAGYPEFLSNFYYDQSGKVRDSQMKPCVPFGAVTPDEQALAQAATTRQWAANIGGGGQRGGPQAGNWADGQRQVGASSNQQRVVTSQKDQGCCTIL